MLVPFSQGPLRPRWTTTVRSRRGRAAREHPDDMRAAADGKCAVRNGEWLGGMARVIGDPDCSRSARARYAQRRQFRPNAAICRQHSGICVAPVLGFPRLVTESRESRASSSCPAPGWCD